MTTTFTYQKQLGDNTLSFHTSKTETTPKNLQNVAKSIQKHQIPQERKALVVVEGYETGKSSSSSTGSPPPPVPPHRNLTTTNKNASRTEEKSTTSKHKKGLVGVNSSDKNRNEANTTSKIDIKALAAKFEKK